MSKSANLLDVEVNMLSSMVACVPTGKMMLLFQASLAGSRGVGRH